MYKRIRDLREDNDLKQATIAHRLGLSQPQYQRYESGVRQIPVDILVQLSKIYDVSVDYLLGLTNYKSAPTPSLNPDDKKVVSYFSRLNQENKDYILGEMIKLHREQNVTQESKKDIG